LKFAKEERRKLASFPIDLRILGRYGIESYFPQEVFERLTGADPSTYFPIPDVERKKYLSISFSYANLLVK